MSCCNPSHSPPVLFCILTGYNTASGMSCCNDLEKSYSFIIKELQYRKRYELLQHDYGAPSWEVYSGVTIPQAVWAVATLASCFVLKRRVNPCYNTASGMSCCNRWIWIGSGAFLVTIPQAVWAVATDSDYSHQRLWVVTIPQAVWAVATSESCIPILSSVNSYNTASGMSCCNFHLLV